MAQAGNYSASETSINPGTVLPSVLGGTVRAFAKVAVDATEGAVFAQTQPGVTTIVTGTGQVDKVYIQAGSVVDARNLLNGVDQIYFTGNWTDYSKSTTAVSGAVMFERQVDGLTERITVLNGATTAGRDQWIFADGAVTVTNGTRTILGNTPTAELSAVGIYDAQTKTPLPGPAVIITTVSSPTANGTYDVGDVIAVTVTFSEEVYVTTSGGTPTLTLETGNTDRTASYASGSGTNTLTFNYTVQTGDSSADLDYTATTALALNNGTIKDAAGNPATLTLASPGTASSLSANKALVIDGVAPTFSTLEATAGTKTITLTTSEGVTGSPAAGDFAVLANSVSNAVTAVNVSGTTVTLTVTDFIANSATVTVAYTQGSNRLTDPAGNALATLSATSVTVTNDAAAPTVTAVSSPTANGTYDVGDVIAVTVTFSEEVYVTTSGGTPTLTLETGNTDRTASYASGSGTNTLTFNYTVQTGDSSADLDYTATTALALNNGTIKDAAGNPATLTLASPGTASSLSANKALVIDGVAPTFSTLEATAGTKTITLTTSEGVTGSPAEGDFAVLANNVSNAVTAVNVSGTTVTLTVTDFIANSATVTVAYTQGSNRLFDTAGNALATLSATSVTVTNDAAAPTVTAVSSTTTDGTYNVGDVIAVTVTFSEEVYVTTSGGTPTLTLETGNTDRTASYASG
ncbi:hypothetical protein FJY94_07730, partial [Candidatus Kaiserbacteria bacterium]|nr:hypothetical protein [Candidatus Kaiserbacteria bacterium]